MNVLAFIQGLQKKGSISVELTFPIKFYVDGQAQNRADNDNSKALRHNQIVCYIRV